MIRPRGGGPAAAGLRPALLALAALAALLQAAAAGPLMAIDFGGEFIKVSVVKPGRTPISIVPNEMSKRRTTAAVAFVGGDRLLGEEAAALAVRYPDRVYARRDLAPAGPAPAPRLRPILANAVRRRPAEPAGQRPPCCRPSRRPPRLRQDPPPVRQAHDQVRTPAARTA